MPSNKHCANIAFHRIKKSGLAPVTLLSKNDSWAMTRRVWFEIGFHLYIHTQQTSIVCKARPFSKFHYVRVCFKCVGSVTFDLPQTLRSSEKISSFLGVFLWSNMKTPLLQWNNCPCMPTSLHWRHNGRDSVSNHQPYYCLLNHLFKRRLNKKHQSFASPAFVWGIHRWSVNSPHKGPVTRKMFPSDDVIMLRLYS